MTDPCLTGSSSGLNRLIEGPTPHGRRPRAPWTGRGGPGVGVKATEGDTTMPRSETRARQRTLLSTPLMIAGEFRVVEAAEQTLTRLVEYPANEGAA